MKPWGRWATNCLVGRRRNADLGNLSDQLSGVEAAKIVRMLIEVMTPTKHPDVVAVAMMRVGLRLPTAAHAMRFAAASILRWPFAEQIEPEERRVQFSKFLKRQTKQELAELLK